MDQPLTCGVSGELWALVIKSELILRDALCNSCILAEMFTGRVFIMGKSNSHQLLRIFNLVGPPKNGAWERFDSVLQYNDVHEDEPSLLRKTISVQEITGFAVNTYHGHGNTDASSWNP